MKYSLQLTTKNYNQRNKDIGIRGLTGPIEVFEDEFKKFLNHELKYSVSFNSGTSGLLAAYLALGIEKDDEIIGSALTYHAALSPAFILGGNIVLCDIKKNTRCIDPDKIESLITNKTKVITVVHQWGHPANMDKIMRIANKYKIKVIEDCSHAHGSKYKGKLCGTFGDVAVFSLQTNKAIFAGEGGILVTNNEEIYNKATLLGHYRDRSKKEVKLKEFNKFWATGFGLKLRMSPFNAIVAKYSLKNFDKVAIGRSKCQKYFIKRLEEIDYIQMPSISEHIDMGAWYGFKPLYIPKNLYNISREKLVKALQSEGVEISCPSGRALALEPLYNSSINPLFGKNYRKKSNNISNTPNAKYISEHGLSLPTFYERKKDKTIIDQYIDAFKKVAIHYKELL